MHSVSDTFRRLWADPAHRIETKMSIDGVEYTQVDMAESPKTTTSLYETPSIGNCVSGMITASVRLNGNTPDRMGEIVPMIRLALDENGATTYSEWINKGKFYIDTRKKNYATSVDREVTDIEGYDGMLQLEQPMVTTGPWSSQWPKTCAEVMAEISRRTGIDIDSNTDFSDTFWVQYPGAYNYGDSTGAVYDTGMSMRKVAGYIAAMHGGNLIITDDGKFRLVPLAPVVAPTDANVGLQMQQLNMGEPFDAITGVRFTNAGVVVASAGTETGRVIEAECPWATAEVAQYVYERIGGYVYRPFESTTTYINPAVELGDAVTVNGTVSVIGTYDLVVDTLCAADVSAPGELEIDHEYPYSADGLTNAMRDAVTEIYKSGIAVGLDSIDIRVEQTFRDGQSIASIQLKTGDTWQEKGQITVTGNVNISGTLSAEALYAALGDIADLTVDRLSTSRRIAKYIPGNVNTSVGKDLTDDNYINISSQYSEWITGVVQYDSSNNPLEEQAVDPNNYPIYWEKDPSASGVTYDPVTGYPRYNGAPIFTTTTATQWPVMVYQYAELVKGSISFELNEAGTAYEPVVTLGAGDEVGRSKGYIRKTTDGLSVSYQTFNKGTTSVDFTNDGYVDIYGLRRTIGLDCTGWPAAGESGTIYETLEGMTDVIAYGVEVSANEDTVQFTYPDGETFAVSLPTD